AVGSQCESCRPPTPIRFGFWSGISRFDRIAAASSGVRKASKNAGRRKSASSKPMKRTRPKKLTSTREKFIAICSLKPKRLLVETEKQLFGRAQPLHHHLGYTRNNLFLIRVVHGERHENKFRAAGQLHVSGVMPCLTRPACFGPELRTGGQRASRVAVRLIVF